MLLKRDHLTELQQDLLHAVLDSGSLTRARGGYVSIAGAKPFSTRTVMAVQRMGLITFTDGGTARAVITTLGSQLLVGGEVELPEVQAG
jgi:hypothetical protein